MPRSSQSYRDERVLKSDPGPTRGRAVPYNPRRFQKAVALHVITFSYRGHPQLKRSSLKIEATSQQSLDLEHLIYAIPLAIR